MTTVVRFDEVKEHWNWRTQKWDDPKFVYIGREYPQYRLPESFYANPYRMKTKTKAARTLALVQYREWLTTSTEGKRRMERVHELDGHTLVCWCKGKAHGEPCHGEILIEFMGEQTVEAAPYESQMGMDGTQPPVLAWDDGGAAYHIGQARNGDFYRTNEKIAHPIGMPGKVYPDWIAWYRDYLKYTLRVKGCGLTMSHEEYARFCYERRLDARENKTDARAVMEREILRELMAELDGDK